MRPIKIGLLYPRSSLYPAIGYDVVEGFRAGLRHYSREDIGIVTDSIGIGGMGDDVYEKAEKMLLNENVDVLVGFLDHFAAEKIEPLAAAANRILIVMDPGASVPVNWSASPLRFHVTLDAAFGSWILGCMAGREGKHNGIFATSFYDGGYLNCNALVSGFNRHKGSVNYNYVAPFRFEEFDIAPLKEAIDMREPDAVLAQLSIEMGALFLKDYKDAGLAEKTHLFAAPFLLEEGFLDSLPFPFEGIKGCVPWSRQLDNEMNRTFIKAMTEEHGRDANCFTALAWDTATFATAVADALTSSNNNGRKAASSLKGTSFDSTRGKMQLDANTNYFTAPLYHAVVVSKDDGKSQLELGGPVSYQDEEWQQFTAQPTSGVFSRWTNTYLCTT